MLQGSHSACIILWSGAIGSIPSGFYLCNGANGTPDLRDRFIGGAGSSYSVAQTGGSADASLVSHTHTATSVVTDPSHSHAESASASGSGGTGIGISGGANFSGSNAANISTQTATTGITVATTNVAAGVSGTGANNPLYYALAYIMAA